MPSTESQHDVPDLAPGSFSWVELATSDQAAAKSFYGAVFGWGVTDIPMGPSDSYSMFKLDGRDAAAAYTLRKEQVSQGVRPHWMIYVAVEDADAAARKATELGGSVLMPAFDVFDAGRMAVVRDPTGAIFSVWQARRHRGLGIAGVDNALCWADLCTPDPETAKSYYSALFKWTMEGGKHDPSDYVHIKNGDKFIGGIPPVAHRKAGTPPHWLAYFQVADCDATAARARELGATFYMPPTTMENVGRIAVVADPQGAAFALFQPAPRAGA